MQVTSASTRPAKQSSKQQAALTRLAGQDEVLRYLMQDGEVPTWNDYVAMNYLDAGEPSDLDEIESQIKEALS